MLLFLFTLFVVYLVPDDVYTRMLIWIVFFQIIFLIAFPGVIIYKNDNMRSYISKLFGLLDPSKNYLVPENRKQDILDFTIVVDQDDRTQENSEPDFNPKDRHITHIFHSNVDHNTITNVDDPIPGCSHW